VLSFLNKDSDTEVIATPRAITMDNETATLSVTRSYPIFLITPGSASVAGGSQINYTNVGTTLKVTPRISGSNNVAITVEPKVGLDEGIDRQIVNGNVNEAHIYSTRESQPKSSFPAAAPWSWGGLLVTARPRRLPKSPSWVTCRCSVWLFGMKTKNAPNRT